MNDAGIIRALGGPRVVAQSLRCKRSRIYRWTANRAIPARQRQAILALALEKGVAINIEGFLNLPAGSLSEYAAKQRECSANGETKNV